MYGGESGKDGNDSSSDGAGFEARGREGVHDVGAFTQAITLFYKQTALHNGLPFELRIPNEETLAAVRQVRSGKGLTSYSSVEQMRADLMKDA